MDRGRSRTAQSRSESLPEDVSRNYRRKFEDLVADGVDIDGEARLVDTLLPRRSTILDAGCGTGRVAAALRRCGHEAFGVDLDSGLLEHAARTYPGLPLVRTRLEDLTPSVLHSAGHPLAYDLVTLVGNVMLYGTPEQERAVLSRVRDLLAPGASSS